ncbi:MULTISPECIES: hypothetical protein [unclassified Mameliella]|uniref:hypothetical protein n=1 Tax=unclassified Mameliella TaxID=2630630 RepID=UPI00273CF80C|nr:MULTISPECIES: hypothetical protein [unclassified Mameliella]
MRKQDIAPRMAEVWEMMPESTRASARAEMVLVQDFLDGTRHVPEREMPALRREFDRCLTRYVTPAPPAPQAAPEPAALPPTEEDLYETVARRALSCFETTVDGSVARADDLAQMARTRGQEALRGLTRNPLKRRRLMRRLNAEIAAERSKVIQ